MAQNTFSDGFLQQDYSVSYDDLEPMSYFFSSQRGVQRTALAWYQFLQITRWTSFQLQSFLDIPRMLADSPSLFCTRGIRVNLLFFQRVTTGRLFCGQWCPLRSLYYGITFERCAAIKRIRNINKRSVKELRKSDTSFKYSLVIFIDIFRIFCS